MGGAVRLTVAVAVLMAATAAPAGAAQVPREVIVRYEPGVARADVRQAAEVSAVRTSRLPGVQLVKVRQGQTVHAAMRELEADPRVRYAEPNRIYHALALPPNDYDPAELWGLARIDAPGAWALATGSSAVRVAVVDSGIAYDHADLAANYDAAHSYDFVGNNDPDPYDVDGHGTHIAGTIGAVGNNATGITGVNWNVSLMAVRVLDAEGSGSTLDIAEGLDYAGDQGARVVNVSLGGTGASQLMHDAMAAHPNTLYVAAAGNEGADNDATPTYPCSDTLLNVICVAATTKADGLAASSNRGATSVDLGAPGVDIQSTIPHWSTLVEHFETDPFGSAGLWDTDGTSPWGWVDTTLENHVMEDSPAVPYAADANSWLGTRDPLPNSSVGCIVGFDSLQFDLGENTAFLRLETSPDGVTWTEHDSWTGTQTEPIESGFDSAGQNVRMRLRLEAFGNDNDHQGVAIDDLGTHCVQKGQWNDYASAEGTSVAAPHVSGVAALALALRPNLTVSRLRDVLLSSGNPLAALAGKTVTGRRLNARNALQPPPSRVPTTGAASGVGISRATLTGAVNPLGTATRFQFQLGTSTAYGSTSPALPAGSGVGPRAVGATISGLAPATTYHYRVVWVRGSERAFGADRTFTTAAPPLTIYDVTVERCRQSGRGRRTRLRCALADADALAWARMVLRKRSRTIARRTVEPNSDDVLTLRLKRRLRKGRYRLTLTLSDRASNTNVLVHRFRVR